VCASCVKGKARDTVGRWAGAPGSGFMVVDNTGEVLGRPEVAAAVGEKRDPQQDEEGGECRSPKRQKVEDDDHVPRKQKQQHCAAPKTSHVDTIASPTVFLVDDFRAKWCRCAECLGSFASLPFLLEEEEAYEPPEDADPPRSVFDPIDIDALNRLPRERVINGLLAWNNMKYVLSGVFPPLLL
jgi:E3 ubiquitin-protein ligase UBR7